MMAWVLISAAAICVATIGVVLSGLRTPRIAMTSSGITIENTWFDRTVPLSDIRRGDVQVVDPSQSRNSQ